MFAKVLACPRLTPAPIWFSTSLSEITAISEGKYLEMVCEREMKKTSRGSQRVLSQSLAKFTSYLFTTGPRMKRARRGRETPRSAAASILEKRVPRLGSEKN